jgi:hypothetical protein
MAYRICTLNRSARTVTITTPPRPVKAPRNPAAKEVTKSSAENTRMLALVPHFAWFATRRAEGDLPKSSAITKLRFDLIFTAVSLFVRIVLKF